MGGLTGLADPLDTSTISFSFDLVTANAANPTELNAIGITDGDMRCVYPTAAGTDASTWYRLDTSSAAVNAPYVMASLTAGKRWVAFAGTYSAQAANILGAVTAKGGLTIQDPTDNTKQFTWLLSGLTTAKTVTIAPVNTVSGTLTIPNFGAADTVATLALSQTYTGIPNFSAGAGVLSQPVGGESVGFWSNWSGSANATRAIQGYVNYTGSFGATAYDGVVSQSGNVAFDHLACYQGVSKITSGSATAAFLAGAYLSGSHAGSGVVTSAYGYYWGGWTGAGTITNKWAFFSAGTEPCYFGNNLYVNGKLSVGTGVVGQTFTMNSAGNSIFELQQASTSIGFIANGSAVFGALANADFGIDCNSASNFVGIGAGGTLGIKIGSAVANAVGTGDATAIGTAPLTSAGGATFAKSIGLGAIAAPGSPFMGQIWNDSTRQGLMTFAGSSTANGIKQCVPGVIFTVNNSSGTGPVSSTSAASIIPAGVGTMTLPANFFTVGKTLRVVVRGALSNGGGGTLTILMKYGSTTIALGLSTPTGTLSGAYFESSFLVTCTAIGVSGSVNAQASLLYANGATAQIMPFSGNTTINTTTANLIDVTAQFSVSSASNSMQGILVTAEALN